MSKKHFIDQSDQKLIEQALGKKISRDKIISGISCDLAAKAVFDTFSPEDQEKIIAFLAGERTLQILCDGFFKKILDPNATRERKSVGTVLGDSLVFLHNIP